jgi:hypothetical protein
MVETSISWLLQQNTDINTELQNRVSPFFREDDEKYPAVTYQKTGVEQEQMLDGSLSSICEHYIDLDIWATSYLKSKTLAEKIKKHLIAFSGDANGNQIDLIKLINTSEDIESDPDRYLVTLKFVFYTNEA